MTWELYGRMKAYYHNLNKFAKFTRRDSEDRMKMIREIGQVSEWLKKAQKQLSFEVSGDWEFSEMAKSKYFTLLPYDPEQLRKVREWGEYLSASRDPRKRWLMLKANPEKHRLLKEKRRWNAYIKRQN